MTDENTAAISAEPVAEQPPQPTLEEQQVARVTPVAQGILEDMTTMLIPEDGVSFNLDQLELATIKRLLAGDLNITTEVPLAFQYVMSGITGLAALLQNCAFSEPHTQAEYADVTRSILLILSDSQVKIGDTASVAESLKASQPELEALFASTKMSAIDVRYIVNSIMSSFETMRNGAEKSIEESMERAQAKTFGVESVQDVTMSKLNTFLEA